MAHEGLWKQLVGLDRAKTAQRAKCKYLTDPDRYVITLLNTEYIVNLSDKDILSVKPGSTPVPAEFIEQLCLLAYLINARDVPLAGKLVKPQPLAAGQFFFRGIHSLDTEKLQEIFGKNPKGLHRIMERFDAEPCEFGDASIRLYVLPRIPVTIVIWKGDEEFEARASILFDQTADRQLSLDALGAAARLTVDSLLEAAGEKHGKTV